MTAEQLAEERFSKYENGFAFKRIGFIEGHKATSSNTGDGRYLLDLAQAEIRAMYKRVGINGSNILSLIDNYLEQTKEVSNNQHKKEATENSIENLVVPKDINVSVNDNGDAVVSNNPLK